MTDVKKGMNDQTKEETKKEGKKQTVNTQKQNTDHNQRKSKMLTPHFYSVFLIMVIDEMGWDIFGYRRKCFCS